MNEQQIAVESVLIDLEQALRQQSLWQNERPSDEALSSTQPFCIDTLSFPQWLQFVLLERLRAMMAANQPLPSLSGIAPMSEEYFRPMPDQGTAITAALAQLDTLLGAA